MFCLQLTNSKTRSLVIRVASIFLNLTSFETIEIQRCPVLAWKRSEYREEIT